MQVQEKMTMMGPCPFGRIRRGRFLHGCWMNSCYNFVMIGLCWMHCLLMEISSWRCEARAFRLWLDFTFTSLMIVRGVVNDCSILEYVSSSHHGSVEVQSHGQACVFSRRWHPSKHRRTLADRRKIESTVYLADLQRVAMSRTRTVNLLGYMSSCPLVLIYESIDVPFALYAHTVGSRS